MSVALSQRLSTVASLVRGGRKTVDVGTDHGYLPAYLAEKNIASDITASDIGKGPLKNAEQTLERYDLSNKITLTLSDGLERISQDTKEIIIAGMGGTLIRDILLAAPWVKSSETHLVLQPMTHSEDVRRYLCENGFEIDREITCIDEKRVYVVISAEYTGKITPDDDYFFHFGRIKNISGSDNKYIMRQLGNIENRYNGLNAAGKEQEAEHYKILEEQAKRNFNL